MKIGIIGVGSIGGLIAGLIANKQDNELILYTNSNIQKYELISNGLTININERKEQLKIDQKKFTIISYEDNIDKKLEKSCDLVLICTKSFSTLEASQIAKKLINDIQKTAEKQKIYKSKHKYDLKKFGLSEKKIKKDCLPIYETFLT